MKNIIIILFSLLGLSVHAQGIKVMGSLLFQIVEDGTSNAMSLGDGYFDLSPRTEENDALLAGANGLDGAITVESDTGSVQGTWSYNHNSTSDEPNGIVAIFPGVPQIRKVTLFALNGDKLAEKIFDQLPAYSISIARLSPNSFMIPAGCTALVSYDSGITWVDPVESRDDGTIFIEEGSSSDSLCLFVAGRDGFRAGCAIWPSSKRVEYATQLAKISANDQSIKSKIKKPKQNNKKKNNR